MKILVCLSSLLREKTIVNQSLSSLIRCVIRGLPTKPDIAGHFPSPESNSLDILREHANKCIFRFEDDPELSQEQLSWRSFISAYQPNGIRTNLLQWLSMKKCEGIKQELELLKGPYDLVFHTRPDLYYINRWEGDIFALKKGELYVSGQDCWRGYNDRYSYGDSQIMGGRMRIYDYFSNYWYPQMLKKMQGVKADEETSWNPEIVLSDYANQVLKANMKKTNLIAIRLKKYGDTLYGLMPVSRGFTSAKFNETDHFDENRYRQLLDLLAGLTRHAGAIAVPPSRIKKYVPFEIIKRRLLYSQTELSRTCG